MGTDWLLKHQKELDFYKKNGSDIKPKRTTKRQWLTK